MWKFYGVSMTLYTLISVQTMFFHSVKLTIYTVTSSHSNPVKWQEQQEAAANSKVRCYMTQGLRREKQEREIEFINRQNWQKRKEKVLKRKKLIDTPYKGNIDTVIEEHTT